MTLYDWHSTSWDLRAHPPDLAILSVGAVEQFGPYLPIGTQNIILEAIARRVGERLAGNVYLLPTWPLGESIQHRGFAGTVALSWRVLMAVVTDLVGSLYACGLRRVVVLTGLGGAACSTVVPRENAIVKTAVRQLNYDHPQLDAIWAQPLTVARPPLSALCSTAADDVHAGEIVTSLMLYLHPDLVREAREDHIPPRRATQYVDALPFRALCPKGVWGRPSLASAELGARILQAAVDGTVSYIEESLAELGRLKRGTGS